MRQLYSNTIHLQTGSTKNVFFHFFPWLVIKIIYSLEENQYYQLKTLLWKLLFRHFFDRRIFGKVAQYSFYRTLQVLSTNSVSFLFHCPNTESHSDHSLNLSCRHRTILRSCSLEVFCPDEVTSAYTNISSNSNFKSVFWFAMIRTKPKVYTIIFFL